MTLKLKTSLRWCRVGPVENLWSHSQLQEKILIVVLYCLFFHYCHLISLGTMSLIAADPSDKMTSRSIPNSAITLLEQHSQFFLASSGHHNIFHSSLKPYKTFLCQLSWLYLLVSLDIKVHWSHWVILHTTTDPADQSMWLHSDLQVNSSRGVKKMITLHNPHQNQMYCSYLKIVGLQW